MAVYTLIVEYTGLSSASRIHVAEFNYGAPTYNHAIWMVRNEFTKWKNLEIVAVVSHKRRG